MEYEFTTNTKKIADEVLLMLIKKGFGVSSLIEKGSLTTYRKEYKIDDTNFCLDHSLYNNKEDYEIECEADSMIKAKQIVRNILDKYNIKYSESILSKQARALNKA